jgi:hypothetical protein
VTHTILYPTGILACIGLWQSSSARGAVLLSEASPIVNHRAWSLLRIWGIGTERFVPGMSASVPRVTVTESPKLGCQLPVEVISDYFVEYTALEIANAGLPIVIELVSPSLDMLPSLAFPVAATVEIEGPGAGRITVFDERPFPELADVAAMYWTSATERRRAELHLPSRGEPEDK